MRKKTVLDQERSRLLPPSQLHWNGRGGAWKENLELSCALTIMEYEPAYKAGEEDVIFNFIAVFGERALQTEWVQGEITKWRVEFFRFRSESAKRRLLKVGHALVAKGQGRAKSVSPEAAQQRTRQRNTSVVQDHRALRYSELGFQAFRKIAEEGRAPARSEWLLRRIAENVASKAFKGSSLAMRQAEKWYWNDVEKEISRLLDAPKN